MAQQTPATPAEQCAPYEPHRQPVWRDLFIPRREQNVLRAKWCGVLKPHHTRSGKEPAPIGLERTLPGYFAQHWFSTRLTRPARLRCFVGIDLGRERAPELHEIWKGQKWHARGGRLHFDNRSGNAGSALSSSAARRCSCVFQPIVDGISG
jgi:hypothetical protein